ncbi:MAG: hypothetical protein N3A54_00650 [Patescibacteria group bacterium]|nr:hypothetical protein [Patescibacteria group bacterium]
MIIIDINSLIIPNIIQSESVALDTIRHMTVNLMSTIIRKFKNDYSMVVGVVVVDDDKRSWRKSFFPYYKSRRSEYRFYSSIDWKKLYKNFSIIKNELIENFPLKFLKVENCEADDLIAVISGYVVSSIGENTLIVSDDKDFFQIHCDYIYQFSPLHNRMISYHTTATEELYMKIFYGDHYDGIPNYVSSDDALVDNSKLNKVSKKRVLTLLDDLSSVVERLTEEERPGFIRNRRLVDFEEIPKEIRTEIIKRFLEKVKEPRIKLDETAKYLKSNNMVYLLKRIGDFEE